MLSLFPTLILCNILAINKAQVLGIDQQISAGYSELITVKTQGQWTNSIDNAQTNCPHSTPGLTTWSYGSAGDITITTGQNILLTQASISGNLKSNTFNRITISQGASLIFNDEDITIHVREILNEGTLTIGSAQCRILNNIHIIFYGDTVDSSLSNLDRTKTSKGIISDGSNAILDIHGKRYHPTWTKLALLANNTDTTITLQDAVNWEIGQEIMITTTIWYDCPDFYEFEWCLQCYNWEKSSFPGPPTNGSDDYCHLDDLRHHENEVRKITNIAGTNNNILTLNESLNYAHYAGREYQAEVVLLSRNILLEGNMDDGTSFDDGYGGHTLATGSSILRMSGTQAHHMGQLNVLGRYPFHMHLLGEGKPSYFEDNSVTNSFFRCYVIHGTDNSLVTRNIAYNAMGHCYYLEDGVEENNTLSYNFAGHIHPIYIPSAGGEQTGETHSTIRTQGYGWTDLALPADTSASGFYISNAYNIFLGNAASGGWAGYFFPNIPYPIGSFFSLGDQGRTNPNNRPTLVFDSNSAHSSGFYWQRNGQCIYCGGELTQTSSVDVDPPTWFYKSGRVSRETMDEYDTSNNKRLWMKFYNTKTFLCQRGVTHWGNQIEIYNYEAYDTHRGAEVFGEAGISNAILCGHSGNERGFLSTEGTLSPNDERNGFRGYDTSTKTILNNIIFRNYKVNLENIEVDYGTKVNSYAYIYETGKDQFIPQNINAVNNISFEDCDFESYLWSDPAAFNSLSGKLYSVYDYSGSLAYSSIGKGPSIVGSHVAFWNIDDNECDLDPYSSLYRCNWDSQTRSQIYLEPYVPGIYDGSNDAGYMSIWGATNRNITLGPYAGIAGISDIGWYWRPMVASHPITAGASPSFFDVGGKSHNRNGIVLASDHFVVLAMRYPKEASFDVRIKSTWWTSTNIFGTNGVLAMSDFETVTALNEGYTDPYNNLNWDCNDINNGLCNDYGGAIGPAWYYDSMTEYLYIRIVNLNCYSARGEWYLGCSDSNPDTTNNMYFYQRNFFKFEGLKLWNPRNNYYYEVTVTCPLCNILYSDTSNNVDWFEITDIIPPLKLKDIVPATPTTTAPTFNPSTLIPTLSPTNTGDPTSAPSRHPSNNPTITPTEPPIPVGETKPPSSDPTTSNPTTSIPTASPTYATICGAWPDAYQGWSLSFEGNGLSDVLTYSTSLSRFYHGPYRALSTAGIEVFQLEQRFYCCSPSTVSVTFWMSFCGTQASDYIQLYLDDNLQTTITLINGTDYIDTDLNSACSTGWQYKASINGNMIPLVPINTLFPVRFDIGLNDPGAWATVTEIIVNCDPTSAPSNSPSNDPTITPTQAPTAFGETRPPSSDPTSLDPTNIPTETPLVGVTEVPTNSPTEIVSSTTDDSNEGNDNDNDSSFQISNMSSYGTTEWIFVGIILLVLGLCIVLVIVFACKRCKKDSNRDTRTASEMIFNPQLKQEKVVTQYLDDDGEYTTQGYEQHTTKGMDNIVAVEDEDEHNLYQE